MENVVNPVPKNSAGFPIDVYYDNKKRLFYVLHKTWPIFLLGFLGEFFASALFILSGNKPGGDSGIFSIEVYFLSLLFLIFYILCVYLFISSRNKWYRFLILLINMSKVPLFLAIYAEEAIVLGSESIIIFSIIPSISFNIIIFFSPYILLNKIDAAKTSNDMETLNNLSNLEQKSRLERTMRSRWFWLLVIIAAWLISFLWLGWFAFVPSIVFLAYIQGIFYLISGEAIVSSFLSRDVFLGLNLMILIPVALNIFFIYFLLIIKIVPKKIIYFLSLFFLLIIVLSLVGCSQSVKEMHM